jgi:glucose uptake protein GlcU
MTREEKDHLIDVCKEIYTLKITTMFRCVAVVLFMSIIIFKIWTILLSSAIYCIVGTIFYFSEKNKLVKKIKQIENGIQPTLFN